MLVKINQFRGEPATRALSLGPSKLPNKRDLVLVWDESEIPPMNVRPAWVEHVLEAEVDEGDTAIAKLLDDGVVVPVDGRRKKRGYTGEGRSAADDAGPAQQTLEG